MYIVCYTIKIKKKNLLPEEYEFRSDWTAVETLGEAESAYNDIFKRDDVYSVTLCKPIESTEAHYTEGKSK